MSELTSKIPFMASLRIRPGYEVNIELSAQTYQVGAHFKALNKAVLVAPLKCLQIFLSFQESLTRSDLLILIDLTMVASC